MKAFVSWSGGKDCMLALYRFLESKENEVFCLLNMCDENEEHSGSHELPAYIIRRQAEAMNVPVRQQKTPKKQYEQQLKTVIAELKTQGVTAGVFGDIYLEAHRVWIERVCSEAGITPVFPLWGDDTRALLAEFIDAGFSSLTVAVRENTLPESWLGRKLDSAFLNEISALNGMDACGEMGEYHSFVYDGPLFSHPVEFSAGNQYRSNNHIYLEIK